MSCGSGPCFPCAAYTNPSVSDFKTYYVRDFPFGVDTSHVMDSDVSNAMLEASNFINGCLFSTQSNYTLGFLRLSAHYLVMNLRASSQGIWGQYPWMTTSKSVGSVSESIQIPDRIMANPVMAMLTKSTYGAAYLFMVLPQLVGQTFSVYGGTNY